MPRKRDVQRIADGSPRRFEEIEVHCLGRSWGQRIDAVILSAEVCYSQYANSFLRDLRVEGTWIEAIWACPDKRDSREPVVDADQNLSFASAGRASGKQEEAGDNRQMFVEKLQVGSFLV